MDGGRRGGSVLFYSAFQKNFLRLFDKIKRVLNKVCSWKNCTFHRLFECNCQSVYVLHHWSLSFFHRLWLCHHFLVIIIMIIMILIRN